MRATATLVIASMAMGLAAPAAAHGGDGCSEADDSIANAAGASVSRGTRTCVGGATYGDGTVWERDEWQYARVRAYDVEASFSTRRTEWDASDGQGWTQNGTLRGAYADAKVGDTAGAGAGVFTHELQDEYGDGYRQCTWYPGAGYDYSVLGEGESVQWLLWSLRAGCRGPWRLDTVLMP